MYWSGTYLFPIYSNFMTDAEYITTANYAVATVTSHITEE